MQVKVWFQNRRMKWRHAQQRAKGQAQVDGENGDGASTEQPTDAEVHREDTQNEKDETGDKEIDADKEATCCRSSLNVIPECDVIASEMSSSSIIDCDRHPDHLEDVAFCDRGMMQCHVDVTSDLDESEDERMTMWNDRRIT